jgi:hypothetical protein
MTNIRRTRRRVLGSAWAVLLAGLVLVGLATSGGAANRIRFWSDAENGFAIGGFDPVAYFVEGQARQGVAGQEFDWQGVSWRFANEGNRAAFAADPDIYSPRFGGFDPVAVGRGNPAEGNPQIWVIHEGNLLLFYSTAFRTLWEQDPAGTIRAAQTRWATIELKRILD